MPQLRPPLPTQQQQQLLLLLLLQLELLVATTGVATTGVDPWLAPAGGEQGDEFSLDLARDIAAEMRERLASSAGRGDPIAPGDGHYSLQTYVDEAGGCVDLTRLARSAHSPEQRRAVLSQPVGGAEAVVGAMRAFGGEPALQNLCCLTLTALAGGDVPDRRTIEEISAAGGMWAAREAVSNFPPDDCRYGTCGVPYCNDVLALRLNPCANVTDSIGAWVACESSQGDSFVLFAGFLAAVLCMVSWCSFTARAWRCGSQAEPEPSQAAAAERQARAPPGPKLGELLRQTICVTESPRILLPVSDEACTATDTDTTPGPSSTPFALTADSPTAGASPSPTYYCDTLGRGATCTRGGRSGRVSAGASCVVCLEIFVGGESLIVLPGCSHRFHAACISEWLESQSSCPVCRAAVMPPSPSSSPSPSPSPLSSPSPIASTGGGERGGGGGLSEPLLSVVTEV